MSRQLPAQNHDLAAPATPPRPVSMKPIWWLWGSSSLLILVVVGYMFVLSQGGGYSKARPELQRWGQVPPFTLQERSGQMMTSADLQGKVWVVNFMYTRCSTECPLLTHAMAQLQDMTAAEPDVRLVSITVDPEYDTPEVLRHYAEGFTAHAQRWLFLTGEKATIHRLALEGFRLGVSDPQDLRKSSLPPAIPRLAQTLFAWLEPATALAHHGTHTTSQSAIMLHSGRFVLVDRQGEIRSYYDGMESESVRLISQDIRRLLQER